jgi:hypothetical protein
MVTPQNISPHQCKSTSAAVIGVDQSRLFASGAKFCRLVANFSEIILFWIKAVNGVAKSEDFGSSQPCKKTEVQRSAFGLQHGGPKTLCVTIGVNQNRERRLNENSA